MPKSLIKEFEYEPDLISEELVQLQRFIHNHHQTIDKYLNTAIDGVFYTERQARRVFSWLEHDVPSLIIPTAEVMAVGYLTNLANRGGTPTVRFGSSLAMGTIAGFLVLPSWRRVLSESVNRHLISPYPNLRNAVDRLEHTYWRGVYQIVDVWNSYDQYCTRAKEYIQGKRQKIADI